MNQDDTLLTPGEVASRLRVDAKTVTRWAERGLLRSIKTPGGHTRLFTSDVDRIINGENINSVEDRPASEHWQGSI
jgi:excisionase family DNA binding protein